MAITKIKTASREEWLALRRGYIGGSDAAAVVGLSPFSSPYRVWAEKSGLIEGFGGNLATEVGSFLEEFVAGLFERETGKKVRRLNASIVNTDYPWAIADVDRVLVGTKEGLEIKTTSALATKKFKNGEFPTQYYCQCVHYLAVLGPEWQRWNLAVLIGNSDFRTYTIERDEDEIAALMKAESELMEKIKNGTPPETHDGDGSVMDSVFACDAEKSVDVSGIANLLEEYTRLKADIDELEHRRSDPWQTDFEAMCLKTVLKRVLKTAPMKSDFARGIAQDETIKTELSDDMYTVPNEMQYDDQEAEKSAEVTDNA